MSSLPHWVLDDFLAGMWPCDYCRRHFRDLETLDAHMLSVHLQPEISASRIARWWRRRIVLRDAMAAARNAAATRIARWWLKHSEPDYDLL